MLLDNPEFFTMQQLGQMNMLPLSFLPAYGMIPYLKRLRGDIVGIEVGVLKAETSHVLLKECQNIKKLYGVDFYQAHKDFDNERLQDDMDFYEKTAIENVKEFGDRFEFIKKNSTEAAKDFEQYSMDFILIDGDHTYEGILSDLESYYPLLKKGGYVFVHNNFAATIRDAIRDFRNKNKIRIPVNMSKNYISYWAKV